MIPPDVSIRRGCSADDPVCGRIVGRALAAGPVPVALPFARDVLTSTGPLPLLQPRRRFLGVVDGAIVAFADVDRARSALPIPRPCAAGSTKRQLSTLLAAAESVVARPPTLTVLACNTPALAFYAARGYGEIERWREPDWHGGRVERLRLGKAEPRDPHRLRTSDAA